MTRGLITHAVITSRRDARKTPLDSRDRTEAAISVQQWTRCTQPPNVHESIEKTGVFESNIVLDSPILLLLRLSRMSTEHR